MHGGHHARVGEVGGFGGPAVSQQGADLTAGQRAAREPGRHHRVDSAFDQHGRQTPVSERVKRHSGGEGQGGVFRPTGSLDASLKPGDGGRRHAVAVGEDVAQPDPGCLTPLGNPHPSASELIQLVEFAVPTYEDRRVAEAAAREDGQTHEPVVAFGHAVAELGQRQLRHVPLAMGQLPVERLRRARRPVEGEPHPVHRDLPLGQASNVVVVVDGHGHVDSAHRHGRAVNRAGGDAEGPPVTPRAAMDSASGTGEAATTTATTMTPTGSGRDGCSSTVTPAPIRLSPPGSPAPARRRRRRGAEAHRAVPRPKLPPFRRRRQSCRSGR